MASEYEKIRLRNIEDNKRILAELGLVNPYKPLPRIIKRTHSFLKRKRDSFDTPSSKRIKVIASATPETPESWTPGLRRRSRRLLGKDTPEIEDVEDALKEDDDDAEEEDEDFRPKISKDRPQVYGVIPGVEIGTHWMYRMEANRVGVHRPVVAGIHPGPNGAYSIALSGGYEDDLDYGECFTYTGEGGRDLKGTKANPKNLRTAPQSKHQSLSRGNKALVDSVESGLPVRVLRGYKLDSPFSPEDGYRYDGLYKVDKWWYTEGLAGFSVYKFALSRLKDQPPPPWYMNTETGDVTMSNGNLGIMESISKEDVEKNCTESYKIEEEANSDHLKEKRDTDIYSDSSASGGREKKDPSKVMMSGSVSNDEMSGAKQEDREKIEKSTENGDSTVSDDFANATSMDLDEVGNKNESMHEDNASKDPSEVIIRNEAGENDSRVSRAKLNSKDEDSENNTDKSSDGERSSTSSRNGDMNSTEREIESNGQSQTPNSVGCGEHVPDELKSAAATSVLHESSSKHLPNELLDKSVDDQNAESSNTLLVTCNNILSDGTDSQDSGLGSTQSQIMSNADVASGDVITVMHGKLEVEDENRNITTC